MNAVIHKVHVSWKYTEECGVIMTQQHEAI